MKAPQSSPPPSGSHGRACEPQAPPVVMSNDDGQQVIDQFLRQVHAVLADQRGMTVQARLMIASIASGLGLSEAQAADALRLLQSGDADCSRVAADDKPGGGKPPVARPPVAAIGDRMPAAADSPPAPPQTAPSPVADSPSSLPPQVPELAFQAYLADRMAESPAETITQDQQRRWVAHGVRECELAEVFARQILQRMATAAGRPLASSEPSADDPPPPEGQSTEPLPPEMASQFLEAAKAILTEQRGVNARSRVLLAAAASSCGLSESQAQQAMQQLQGQGGEPPGGADHYQAERERALRDAMLAGFRELPHQLLHARDEQRWLQMGQLRYGVPEDRVAELIADAANQANVRVVSADTASGHVYQLAADLLDQGYRLEQGIRTRIVLEGAQWGLSEPQVDAILQDVLQDQQQVAWKNRRLLQLTLAGLVVLAAMLFLVVWLGFAPRRDQEPAELADGPHSPAMETTIDPQFAEPPWWSDREELQIAATRLRLLRPDLKDILQPLGQSPSDQRIDLYRELVPAAVAKTDLRLHGPQLWDFFAGCLAWDPDADAADALAASLLELVPRPGSRLPERSEDDSFEVPFWAVRTFLEALMVLDEGDERGERLAAALGTALGTRIDRHGRWRELDRQSTTALSLQLFHVLIAAAPSQPPQAARLFAAVSRRASRFLDAAILDQRTADLLTATLPAAQDAWPEYQYLLQSAINSNEPAVVLRIVDLYERAESPELRQFLAERLLRRVRLLARSVPSDEVARQVRQALGAKQPVSERQRYRQLTALMDQRRPSGNDAAELDRLQELVGAVHVGTLACALSQGEAGLIVFDQLYADGPVVLSTTAAADPRMSPQGPSATVSSVAYRNAVSNIGQLSDMRNRRRESAPMYLKYLATVAPKVPDLPGEHAVRLARYLLAAKSDNEHRAVLTHAHAITRWPNVRLALADQVLQATGNRDRVVELLEIVLGGPLDGSQQREWQQRAYERLLRDVIRSLGHAGAVGEGPERWYDDVAEFLRESYAVRARLIGVPIQRTHQAATLAELLQMMIQHQAALQGSASNQAIGAVQNDVEQQLIAIDYISDNDLQHAVLLQRLWLELLIAQRQQTGGLSGEQATRLQAQIQESDRQATDLIDQLLRAERHETEIWLSQTAAEHDG